MLKNIAIVGAGINGLLSAFLITEKYPDIQIYIYDAEDHPVTSNIHKGITYSSRDARHITGSESISFESSIHKEALRNSPGHNPAGWLLKSEYDLTHKEKQWRDKFEASYKGDGAINKLDYAHAELNYKGLRAWHELIHRYPFIQDHVIADDSVEVYFRDKASFEADFSMETDFCRQFYKEGIVKSDESNLFNDLYDKKLILPGMTIRVKSLALDLLNRLENNQKVNFYCGKNVKNSDHLQAQAIVWTTGVTHVQPDVYDDLEVQGIVGCWTTLPNHGMTRPFKIAAPTPSAYLNFTPDGNSLHISGGFGWTGEYTEPRIVQNIAKPVAEHFIGQINHYLKTNISLEDVNYCVRSSTPTGQPLQKTKSLNGKSHIFITGSGKSGTTHAPVLSQYVINQIEDIYE